jgi:TRAP-type C4-dicarboxylate transport system permease small subunit
MANPATGDPAASGSQSKVVQVYEKITQLLIQLSYILMTLSILSIFVIVNIQVFFRYVLKTALGGVEELPVYIMAMCVWLSTPVISKEDKHINIDLFVNLFKSDIHRMILKAFAQLTAGVSMSYFAGLAFQYVQQSKSYGEVTGGLGIPIWVFHAVIFYGALMVAVFAFINLANTIIRIVNAARQKTGGDGGKPAVNRKEA